MAKAHTLTDNFNGNAIDTDKWGFSGPSRQVNQRLEIPLVGYEDNSYGFLGSNASYDLTDSEMSIEVVQTLNTSPDTETSLDATKSDYTDWICLSVRGGQLRAFQVFNDVDTVYYASIPYDCARHRWWRIRESHGKTYFETSPDGEAWDLLVCIPSPPYLNSVYFTFGAATLSYVASPGVAIFDSFNMPPAGLPRRVEERRLSALAVREQAAELAAERGHPTHANNNDEVNYPDRPFIGNYSKALRHDAVGDPEPISYGSLLRALESRDPGDFEEILQPSGARRLSNPQAGLAFDLEAPDAQAVTQPSAPRFDSAQTAAEMGELYWMALARDVPFLHYATEAATANTVIARSISSLNTEFRAYGGPFPVTVQNLFRGIYPGEQVGPYVSQFLLKGNVDPRKQPGQGRDARDGFITYGTQVIDQRQLTVKGFPQLGAAADYLTAFPTWLAVQNGRDDRGQDQFDPQRRFLRNLRDGANFVHFDQVVNAWWNAAFLLLSEPRGNQNSSVGAGRPQVDMEFFLNPGNPYDPPGTAGDSRTQVGFATFGPVHLLQLLIEVAGRAGRAVWWQKWGVHRRLRPEEYGGRVDNQFANRRTYPLHASLVNSLSTGLLSPYFSERYGSFLLPQAYPEGCPTHPAYGAGHATISGACATILKAFFDEGSPIESPVVAAADGLSLVSYTGADAAQMTVGGELNKLAGNISLFRNAAGVHWRSDYTESLPLGERVAIGLLQELSLTFNEDDAFFQFTKFDGTLVRIHRGLVKPVPPT
jgi:hypothetical protein